ncbi:MAG: bifunctional diaminohydroxyphosphoribosylaminopyrimidine deaminase/5-amino-6-(5-phosphoribosylamino)uracil reductase RibD [Muribaculaceae bacterium]|nr:bifunctional diaminohydroxyphosphoribosylaminopyrimidine deaminase/5-amino-6-(5-phosphoribosylamino)uracil reductase RibD [Muribaculaceae bacterium]
MSITDMEEHYMRRALQLAANGRGHTSPNPMVGSVIVAPDGRIIGEGWHRCFGGPHAEVNAMNSVAEADRGLVGESTVYVTLEPCSHYGKTPPCAKMLVDRGVRRVVVGAGDPNPKVAGRGIAMLREAGIEVTEGVLREGCTDINREFMTAHSRRYPYVILKWAQSADGFLDGHFSGCEGQQLVHSRRANADAIIVGAGTVIADRPRLDTRAFGGRPPRPVVLDRHSLLEGSDIALMHNPRTLHVTDGATVCELLERLYADYGYISVLVEGGGAVLREFIESGLWDEAHVEVSPDSMAGKVPAPQMPGEPYAVRRLRRNTLYSFRRR